MNDDLLDAGTLAYVIFSTCVAVSFLLCVLAATDNDEPAQFYTGSGAMSPAQNGLALAGDYVSAATVISTTGAIALTGADEFLSAGATVLSLFLLRLRFAEPLAGGPRHYTLGDILARRLRERPARTAPPAGRSRRRSRGRSRARGRGQGCGRRRRRPVRGRGLLPGIGRNPPVRIPSEMGGRTTGTGGSWECGPTCPTDLFPPSGPCCRSRHFP